MPRYFITTDDHFKFKDEEGLELPDRTALRKVLRQTLAEMLHDAGADEGKTDFSADAVDEGGRCVVKARLVLTFEEL